VGGTGDAGRTGEAGGTGWTEDASGPGAGPGAALERQRTEGALRALSEAYAAAVDARDGDRLAALFVPDGALVVPRFPDDLRPVVTRRGAGELRSVPAGLGRYVRTLHLVEGAQFDLAGDRASGVVTGLAHHVTADGQGPSGARPGTAGTAGSAGTADAEAGVGTAGTAGTDTVWFIRYADEYARTGDRWRFARRTLHLLWVEQRPVTALAAAEPPETG
jgi:SnoaL-like domain